MKRRTFSLFLIISSLAILLILMDYAPRYLTYADSPIKADAIVLFVGTNNDNKARQEEADLLITQAYARYFLIPAYGKMHEVSSDIWGHDPNSPEIGIVYPDVSQYSLRYYAFVRKQHERGRRQYAIDYYFEISNHYS